LPTFEGLFTYRLLRLHKLSGDRQDTYAATIHGRWRLILRKISETEILIEEVSNHYGD
jgi:plasmid maintenance system killer protein